MRIDKKYHLDKAVSRDPSRESLQNIWTSQRHAFATNGRILAAVPIDQEMDDTSGWLTIEALKLARRASKGSDSVVISLNGQMNLPGGVTLPRPTETRFPHVFRLLRSAFTDRNMRIALNAGNLKDLADSIGSEEVVLEVGKPEEVILIRPIQESNSACGLLMPVRLNHKRRS